MRVVTEATEGMVVSATNFTFAEAKNYTVHMAHSISMAHSESLHRVEEGLSAFSLACVYVFGAELLLLLIGRGWRLFLSPLHLLDFVVIVMTLFLHYSLPHEPIGAVLVFTRVWHFVRIIHGVYLAEHELQEQELDEAVEALHAAQLECKHAKNEIEPEAGTIPTPPAEGSPSTVTAEAK